MAYQYVAEPGSGLQCVICLEVAEDPWQHGQCGRLFCFEYTNVLNIAVYGLHGTAAVRTSHPKEQL